MSKGTQGQLPSVFTSLYRLFLRTSSASVLHHKGATRNLRSLWRPTFDGAARVMYQLQDTNDAATQKELETWLNVWERRVDNTLSLLYTSCKSRGLPHQLTRNLAYLVLSEKQRLNSHRYEVWKPQLPPTSPAYQPPRPPTQREKKKAEKQERWKAVDTKAWAALGQVVHMAEARNRISLGRVAVKGNTFQKV